MKYAVILSAVVALGLLAGCAGRPSLLPNTDPALRGTSAQFAADAAKRHPYKAEAPHAGSALASCEYDVAFNTLQILNYSDEDWHNVEVWVNRKYVCDVPLMEKGKERVKVLTFLMLYDDAGNYLTTDGGKEPIKTVELYHDGKMYSVSTKIGD